MASVVSGTNTFNLDSPLAGLTNPGIRRLVPGQYELIARDVKFAGASYQIYDTPSGQLLFDTLWDGPRCHLNFKQRRRVIILVQQTLIYWPDDTPAEFFPGTNFGSNNGVCFLPYSVNIGNVGNFNTSRYAVGPWQFGFLKTPSKDYDLFPIEMPWSFAALSTNNPISSVDGTAPVLAKGVSASKAVVVPSNAAQAIMISTIIDPGATNPSLMVISIQSGSGDEAFRMDFNVPIIDGQGENIIATFSLPIAIFDAAGNPTVVVQVTNAGEQAVTWRTLTLWSLQAVGTEPIQSWNAVNIMSALGLTDSSQPPKVVN